MKSEMLETIMTIDDLNWAKEHDFDLVQRLFREVTVEEDVHNYLLYLNQSESETIVATRLKRNKKRSKGVHPSSACKRNVCLLKLYYDCVDGIEPNRSYEEKMQLTWDLGTLLHDTWQVWFNDMYKSQFRDEVKLKSDDGYIQSQTDGIFSFTRLRIILEMKSIKEGGNFGWEKVQAKPMEDNVKQAHFYMWLADVPFAIIFYLDKNSGLFKEHAIMFNQNLWDEMMDEVIAPVVSAAYLDGPIPEATPDYMGCQWCDYSHGCAYAYNKRGDTDDIDW